MSHESRPEPSVDSPESGEAADSGISRRSFVKKGSSFLLVSTVGCGDGTNPLVTGNIRLILTGLHASAATGGRATATPSGGGNQIIIDIPASGDQIASVPVGTYTVSYVAPTNHVVSSATPVPPTVTINEGQTTTVSLTLIQLGNIQVNVTGITGSPANGGSAEAQRTDAAGTPIPISVSAAGSGTASNVPVGTYSVTYTPPGGHTVSGTNPVTGLAVVIGATAVASFSVGAAASTGTIHVTVTGLTGASTGGSVSARLTNNTGSTFPGVLPTPVSGTTSVDLTSIPAGSYNVTYTPPGGYQLTSGTTNPAVVSVTVGGTGNANFAGEVIPAAGGIIFRSSWSSGIGTSSAAMLDSTSPTPWTGNGGGAASKIEAFAITGWPVPNAFVVRSNADGNSPFHQIFKDLGQPAQNSHRYFRLYVAHMWGDSHGDGTNGNVEHGIESADASSGGGDGWNIYFIPRNNGTWWPAFREISTGVRYIADGLSLTKNATYRFEWHIAYGTTSYTVEIKIYNAAGTQIASDADFYQLLPSLNTSLKLTTAVFSLADFLDHAWFRVGCNGPSSNYPLANILANDPFRAHGAAAVSTSGWVGPFAGGI